MSIANIASMEAFVQREQDRVAQKAYLPCESTRDGTHTWQFSSHGLNGAKVYECNCGAVEVRK